MDWTTATSHCFVCGNVLSDYYCQFKWQQQSVDDGRSSCVSSLCTLLTFDYESSKHVFANSSFCDVCLETIFEVDFILKTKLNLQMRLDHMRNQLQNLLRGRYKTQCQSTDSTQTPQEDLYQIIMALGINKPEIKIEDDEDLAHESDPLQLPEAEPGFILSYTESSDERLRCRKARQQLVTASLPLFGTPDEADCLNVDMSNKDPLADHSVCPSVGIETPRTNIEQSDINPFHSIDQLITVTDPAIQNMFSPNVYFAVLSNPAIPSGIRDVAFVVPPPINEESDVQHTKVKLRLTCNFRKCQDGNRKPLLVDLPDIRRHLKLEHSGHSIQTPYHCAICAFRTATPVSLQRHIQLHLQMNQDSPSLYCNMTTASSLGNAVPVTSKKRRLGGQARGESLNVNTCSVCFARYHCPQHVKGHEALHQHQDPLKCVICPKSITPFPTKQNLIDHVALEHSDESRKKQRNLFLFPCNFPECASTDTVLRTGTAMIEHLAEVHQCDTQQRLTHHCTQCDRQYKAFGVLQRHIETKHMALEYSFTCSVCDSSFIKHTSLIDHLRKIHTVTVDSPRCSRCSKKFESNEELSQHESRHSDETPFHCVLCSKKLKTTAELHCHVAAVHELLPFPCKEDGCNQAFISEEQLLAHQPSHKQVLRIHKCPHCSYQGCTSHNLNVHIATHKIKNISCSVEGCSTKFIWKSGLTKHMRRVHNIGSPLKKLPCPICKKEFESLSRLAEHERFHGTEHPFMCEICSSRFKTKSTLSQHLKRHSKWEQLGIEEPKPRKKKTTRFVLVEDE